MAAYLVASYDITNAEAYENYVPAIIGTIFEAGIEVLAADYESDVLEGAPRKVTVILKGESKEALNAWYNSDGYQAGIHHRVDNTEGTMVIVNEFEMPG